jgi:hypothetical protein
MTRLSCHRFRSNQVWLGLSVLAHTLGNLWRRLALPKRIDNWSLTSLQQRLVKRGGQLVKHARYCWLFLAEGHRNRRRFEPCWAGSRCYRDGRDRELVAKAAGESVYSGFGGGEVLKKRAGIWGHRGLCWYGW